MSSNRARPARVAALLFGTIAVAAIPAAVALSVFTKQVKILSALEVAVAGAFFFAVCGWSASRRARFKLNRSVVRFGQRSTRLGRFLVFLGLYASVVGALTLGFYTLLRNSQ